MQTHFVTGATGFVGRYLVEALLERGDIVYVFIRPDTQSSPKFREYLTYFSRFGKKLRYCSGNLFAHKLGLGADILLEFSSQELIFWHLAANLSFSESEKNAVAETNIGGTVDLVPVDYVIAAAIRLSQNRLAYNRIYHLTNPNPGSYLFYFSVLLEDLGLKDVYKLKLPVLLFNLLFSVAALIPGPTRKYFRSVCWYLPYITGKTGFDRTNVKTYVDIEFPELDRRRMRNINMYARNTIYERIK